MLQGVWIGVIAVEGFPLFVWGSFVTAYTLEASVYSAFYDELLVNSTLVERTGDSCLPRVVIDACKLVEMTYCRV